MKKYRLRGWVKVAIGSLFVLFIVVAVIQFFTIKTIHTTPYGSYTCIGRLIKVCGGSRQVADYLGA